MKEVIVAVVIILSSLMSAVAITDFILNPTPIKVISHSTGECVKMIIKGEEVSCDPSIEKYTRQWTK